ncbi:hypothetical protein RHCRD62_40069 [Rhodococcus sp. RD6.2]|nr:hypothetical protein RHCRD62_40069 [Rhodococcus sp. RD6.2]
MDVVAADRVVSISARLDRPTWLDAEILPIGLPGHQQYGTHPDLCYLEPSLSAITDWSTYPIRMQPRMNRHR